MLIEEDYNNTAIAVIMPPGYTEVCAHVNTVEDKIYNEPNEQFCINVTSNVSIGIFRPAECQIIVTIIDNRGKKIFVTNDPKFEHYCLA